MKKYILMTCAFLATLSSGASAEGVYQGAIPLNRVFTQGTQMFVGSTSVLQKTCNFFGSQVQFDVTTPKGKIMSAMILQAKAAGESLDMWYESSSTQGLVGAACSPGELYGVGFPER